MSNVIFLGTSHIARQSLDEVRHYIESKKPDIVALELDRKRLPALLSKDRKRISMKAIKYIGLKGYLFSIFGAWAEQKLGKLVGVAPGSEMKEAIKLAREKGIEIALVDQDIQTTLKRLSKELTWKEKRNFMFDLLKAFFGKKEKLDFDLSKVPDKKIIEKLTARLKKRYPNIHKVLIEERNNVIAQKIHNTILKNPGKKILAILGAGHIEEVGRILNNLQNNAYGYSFSHDQYI